MSACVEAGPMDVSGRRNVRVLILIIIGRRTLKRHRALNDFHRNGRRGAMKTPPMTANQAKKILLSVNSISNQTSSKTNSLYAKSVELKDGTTLVKLFQRSAAKEKWLAAFAPKKLAQQKEFAFTKIKEAITQLHPMVDSDLLMKSLGIQNGLSLKANRLGQVLTTLKSLDSAANANNIHKSGNANRHRFDQWRLQATPELNAIIALSPNQLWPPSPADVKNQASSLALISNFGGFQNFVKSSVQGDKSGAQTIPIDQTKILNFIQSWCSMNDTERAALRNRLSAADQRGFDAISVLVKKMVAVDGIPVTQSDSFGLDRAFARNHVFQQQRNKVKKALVEKQGGKGDSDTKAALQDAAHALGKSLAHKWQTGGQPPRNYTALDSQFKAAARSFLNTNMESMFREIPVSEQDVARQHWALNREAFISTMLGTAKAAVLDNAVSKGDGNQIIVGSQAYAMGQIINKGGEGMVRLAQSPTGQKIAIKSALQQENDPHIPNAEAAGLATEIDRHYLASRANHPNILTFHGAWRNDDGALNMAMEYAPYGDMAGVLAALTPEKRSALIAKDSANKDKLQVLDRYIARSIFSGLRALHEDAQMVHGDLKAANVFIAEGGVPKLADFGKSVLLEENILNGTSVDAMKQLAPEVAVNLDRHFELTAATDIWSAGIILYQLLTGEPFPIKATAPIRGGAEIATRELLRKFSNDPAMRDDRLRAAALGLETIADKDMAGLLLKIFHPEPDRRPTARQVLALLQATKGSMRVNDAEPGELLKSGLVNAALLPT